MKRMIMKVSAVCTLVLSMSVAVHGAYVLEQDYRTLDLAIIGAAKYGDEEAILQYLKCGAYIEATTSHGLTPLLFASYYGHISCVKTLLREGASPSKRSPIGSLTAYNVALIAGNLKCAKVLEKVTRDKEQQNTYKKAHIAGIFGDLDYLKRA